MMINVLFVCFLVLPYSRSVEIKNVIQPTTLFRAMQDGAIQILVDVRSSDEWVTGHVANATLVENLASAELPSIELLQGCEACTMAVMCRTGARAAEAIARLQSEFGFTGTIYNALGVSQWETEGLPLVLDAESKIPACTRSSPTAGDCPTSDADIQLVDGGVLDPKYSLTAIPTASPSAAPVGSVEPTTSSKPSASPTIKPVPNIESVQGTVDRAQEAESSTTKQWLHGTTLVGLVLLSLPAFL